MCLFYLQTKITQQNIISTDEFQTIQKLNNKISKLSSIS